MNIILNGKAIEYDENDDLGEILHTAKCVCGHELYLHAFYVIDKTIFTSQCVRCPSDLMNDTFSCEHFVEQSYGR